MSSATAPARAGRHASTEHGRVAELAAAARVAGHHLLRAAQRDRRPGHHRPHHGAVGLGDRVARQEQRLVLLDLPPAGAVRRGRRRRAWSSRRGSRWPAGSAWPLPDPRSARWCCSCWCFTPLGVERQRQPELDRRRPASRCSPPSSSSSASCSFGAAVLTAQAQAPRSLQARPGALPRALRRPGDRCSSCSATTSAPSRPGRDRRGGALRRRRALALFAFGGSRFAAMAVASSSLTSQNRLARFDVWLGRDTDAFGAARQPLHGRYALADGGWWGVGLGASREKWQLALRAAQRLHLRHHRRGARAARHAGRPRPLRRAGARLLPPRAAHRRLLRPARDGAAS